jgi:pyruvate dehydrogenase kinase 2/3/4
MLSNVKKRHDPVVTSVAQGILEFKRWKGINSHIDTDIKIFLDRFYMSRIGIRVLIGQHITLNKMRPDPDYVGIICTKTNIHDIANEAIENATYICEDYFNLFKGPPVILHCPKDLNFMYIPSHLVRWLDSLLESECLTKWHRTTCSLKSSRTR